MIQLRFLIALLVTATSAMAGQRFKVDKAHSSITFDITHLSISTTSGRFKEFEGHWVYDKDKKQITEMQGTVKVKSIDTDSDSRDKHLRNEEFFNVEKYPEMEFKLLRHTTNGKLTAKLTIKDVTKTVVFDSKVSDVIESPMDKSRRQGITLTTTINRKDFNVGNKYPDKVISDDVEVKLQFEGILQK